MALFKPFRGTRATLDSKELHDGYAYFCTDDGSFHIDYVDKDGNLQRKQINAKDAETLCGMSLEEIQKSISWNDLLDRPFGDVIEKEKFLDNQVVNVDESNGIYSAQIFNDDVCLIEGQTYEVTIADDSYQCIASVFNGSAYIGNLSIVSSIYEDTNEPFLMYYPVESSINCVIFYTTLEGDSHTISLSKLTFDYHQLDEKYIPDTIARVSDFEEKVNSKPGILVPKGTQFTYSGVASNYTDITVTAGENSEIFNELSRNSVGNSYAHAEGYHTLASGRSSHAQGENTAAIGYASHAEGSYTVANENSSHAEGYGTLASNYGAHAEGNNTIAAGMYQHVQGKWNIEDGPTDDHDGRYAHIVGNGRNKNNRSNAHTLDWSGNAWFAGDVKVGGAGQDDEDAKILATQDYVQSFLPKMTTVTIPAANWTGDSNPWSQVVTINGVTANSKVDLQPTAYQIVELQNADIALMTENNNGVVTVYALGGKPTVDYTMQVLMAEVAFV